MTLKGGKVLVTGGSGFIASHLCRRLVDMGVDLHVLVKYNSVMDNIRLADIWDKITPVEADLRNPDSLKQLAQLKPERIYHLAAYNHVGDSFMHVSEAVDSNGKGTINLLEAYRDYERFVYISSSEVYGYQESVPFHEDATPFPLSPYAVGKYMGELYARSKWHAEKSQIVVVRPFNAYGPYQSPRAITAEMIIKCLLGDDIVTTEGYQTREFNFVENLVDGLILAGTRNEAVGEVINLGCGQEVSIRDLVQRIHKMTNSSSRLGIGELPDRPGEIRRMSADNNRAREVLGWSPKVDHDDGLAITIEWYRRFLAQFGDPSSDLRQLGR